MDPSGDKPNTEGAAPSKKCHEGKRCRFTKEEFKVLRECNRDCFIQRSLPLGTLFGVATYFGVQKGYFTPNARFGAAPKVVLAVLLGGFIGRISYQGVCVKRLKAIQKKDEESLN